MNTFLKPALLALLLTNAIAAADRTARNFWDALQQGMPDYKRTFAVE